MSRRRRKTSGRAAPSQEQMEFSVEEAADVEGIEEVDVEDVEGIAEPEAKRLTGSVIKGLCRTLGGKQVYFPVGHQRAVAARNALIRAKHDGTTASVRRLAQEYGLSEIHVYRILSQRPGTRCHPK